MNEERVPGAPERLHWSVLLSSLAAGIRGMWGVFAGGAYLAVQGHWGLVLVGLLLLAAFSLAAAAVGWSRFSFVVAEDEIRIDSGIVSRTHRSIPFDRIQDVDITQGPLARVFGVAKVKFETGGGSGDAEDGVLGAIHLQRAEDLRNLVRARRSGLAAARVIDEAAETARPVYAMDLRRLLLAGLFNFSLALFAGLFGATQTMGDLVGFDPFRRQFWVQVLSAGSPVAEFVLAHRIAAALGGLSILGLLGLITGVVRTTLRDFGFRVDRTDAGLRRRRGLLTRSDVTLPVARVQAAVVATGPIKEHFGWRELRLQNLARDEGAGDHVVAPLADDQELDGVVAELGWRPTSLVEGWQPVSVAYFWSRTIWLAPVMLAAAVQALFVPWLGLAAVLVILAAIGAGYLSWRRTRYVLDGDRLLVQTGWWRRRTIILPVSRIQTLELSENPVTRLFGTANLRFGVAGGGIATHTIPALKRETARDFRAELLSRWA